MTSNERAQTVLDMGAEYYGIPVSTLVKPCRHRSLVDTRHIIMYAMRSLTGITLKETGDYFNRDHTSVIHSCRVAQALIETDDLFRAGYEGFLLALKGKGVVS